MSDRKLLSAKQLRITEAERDALLWVRHGLATGRFQHREKADPGNPTDKPIFNMGEVKTSWACGQVGCIGGWMAFVMGLDNASNYVGSADFDGSARCSKALTGLFYPTSGAPRFTTDGDIVGSDRWSKLTARQAVRAIDKFLASGVKYPWKGIL